ncbi:MAG: V-type ATP synthase subunit A, partial [Petrimonas sp.]|nr:V-type ATP synthase subunit A [Petrimonas sp.]
SVTPIERQKYILDMVVDICRAEFEFENFNQVAEYFKKLINVCRQMNYSEFKSDKFNDYRRQLEELINN